MSLLNESKRFDDFTSEEKRQIFNIFTQSYQKATGSSWDEGKFYSRASEWLFFGDPTGFVTVRPQKSGYYKLTGVAGNMKSILKALQELNTTHYPIWGMLTQELANILVRRYGFRMPNRVESFIIGKLISNNVFGNVEHKRNPDGSITFNYKDVGESTKVFVGNREYYKKARLDAVKRVFSPKQPVTEEVIDEKRAVEHHYEDSFKTLVAFISRFGYDKIYVSFRKTINTGFINRENAYDTPTGFYMYPIKSYQEKIAKVTNMKSFMQVFPFTPDSQFAFVFTLEKTQNILFSSNPDIAKIQGYVKEIEKKYGENKSVSLLCKQYFNVNDTFISRISNSREYKNEFQKLWLFIYEIAFELKNKGKEYDPDAYFIKYAASYTSICLNLNISGFVDDGCLGIIFPNEPCQGVLFKDLREITGNLKIIPIYQKYDTAPNIDNSNNDNKNNVSPAKYKEKYESYLAKKLNVNYVTIYSTDYSTLIKNHKPFIVLANNILYFVNKDGNLTVGGVDTDNIFNNNNNVDASDSFSSERTAYFNTSYGTEYTSVDAFGRYGGDVAYAVKNEGNGGVFINKEGKPDISNIDLDEINDGYRRAEYFNQLLGENKFEKVGKFENYGGEITMATILSSGESIFINKQGKPDVSNVILENIGDRHIRATYFNQKNGTDYAAVYEYGTYGNDVAVATNNNSKYVFVNKAGVPDISNVKLSLIDNGGIRAAYFNQKNKTNYTSVDVFNTFGKGVALARDANDKHIFINKKGQSSTATIDVDSIEDSTIRAIYFNQRYKTNYTSVDTFDRFGKDVSYAIEIINHKNKGIFINREGKPDISGVDINLIQNDLQRGAYINQKTGSNYLGVVNPNVGGKEFNIYFAQVPNSTYGGGGFNYIFITPEGQPTIDHPSIEKLKTSYNISTVDDIVNTTKKYIAGELKENILNLKSIVNEEVSNYFQK
jgi:hypothetical protein